MDDAETEFGLGMAALGGERIPSPRLGEVAVAADAARVEKPELRLGVDKPLFGRVPAPAKRLGRLRLDREAVRKDQLAIALGDLLVDRRRGLIPSRDAAVGAAVQIGEAQLVLRLRMPLLGRAPQPDDAIAEAGDDPFAAQVKQTQPIRAFGLAGQRPPAGRTGMPSRNRPRRWRPCRGARPGSACGGGRAPTSRLTHRLAERAAPRR